jgi:hypothetical protein
VDLSQRYDPTSNPIRYGKNYVRVDVVLITTALFLDGSSRALKYPDKKDFVICTAQNADNMLILT